MTDILDLLGCIGGPDYCDCDHPCMTTGLGPCHSEANCPKASVVQGGA